MMTLFGLHGIHGITLLNTGLGMMRAAMGASDGEACTRPSICSIEGDGNEGGGFLRPPQDGRPDPEPLLEAGRSPIPSHSPNEREARIIATIRDELNEILGLTSGPLSDAVKRALRGLQIEHLWVYGQIDRHLTDQPHATRAEINTLVTDIRERKRRPEFQAYAAALARFHEANSSLTALRKRFAETGEPFPPDELRGLIEALWHANERTRTLQQEMNAYRQAVIDAWRAD
jgi:hypothetical protein